MNSISHSEHGLGDGDFSLFFAAGFVSSHGGDGCGKASCGSIESGLVIEIGGFGATTLLPLVKLQSRLRVLTLEVWIAIPIVRFALVSPCERLPIEVAFSKALLTQNVDV